MHPLFTYSSAAIYLAHVLFELLTTPKDSDRGLIGTAQLVCLCLLMIFSLSIGICVNVYPRDLPFESRNYIPVAIPNQPPPYNHSFISRCSSVADERKKLPIITAKVTSQISIGQANTSERVLFQIIVKENGVLLKTTKRTYQNFKSLDDLLTEKYHRLIARGQLHKRALPDAGNMSSIAGISILSEQLNLYLKEILKVNERQSAFANQPPSFVSHVMTETQNINYTLMLKDSNATTIEDKSPAHPLLGSKTEAKSPKPIENGGNEDDDDSIEFSTDRNSNNKPKGIQSNMKNQGVSQRSEKTQGFLPRELLQFLDLDFEKIEDFMNN